MQFLIPLKLMSSRLCSLGFLCAAQHSSLTSIAHTNVSRNILQVLSIQRKTKKAYEHEDRYYNLFNRLSDISNFPFFIPLTPLDDRMT